MNYLDDLACQLAPIWTSSHGGKFPDKLTAYEFHEFVILLAAWPDLSGSQRDDLFRLTIANRDALMGTTPDEQTEGLNRLVEEVTS